MKLHHLVVSHALLGALAGIPANAVAAIDADAGTVMLRTSCQSGGVELDNCFTTMSNLQSWIDGVRLPDVAAPLSVEIGPGTFSGFNCKSGYHVTLRGSGRQHSFIDRGRSAYAFTIAPSCVLDVESLTVTSNGGLGAINLNNSDSGSGQTTWSDVDVFSTAYGWTESSCSNTKHYWFGSRIQTRTGFSIARAYSSCSENWFFGSEIAAIGTTDESVAEVFAFGLQGSETHVYGSVIRAIAESGVQLQDPTVYGSGKTVKGMVAVSVGAAAEMHIHGTGIDAMSSEANNIAVLGVHPGGKLHANVSSYNLTTGAGGTISRILDTGADVHAPFQWEAHSMPPNVVSVTGADTAVVTDGALPRMLIYSSACSGAGGPWVDVTTGNCR